MTLFFATCTMSTLAKSSRTGTIDTALVLLTPLFFYIVFADPGICGSPFKITVTYSKLFAEFGQ